LDWGADPFGVGIRWALSAAGWTELARETARRMARSK